MIDLPGGPTGRIAWRPERTLRTPDHGRPPRRVGNTATTADHDGPLARVEAALLVARKPLTAKKLADAALLPDAKTARAVVDRLSARLAASGSAFRVASRANGYRLQTDPELALYLDRVFAREARPSLGTAAAEVLAVIAYRQPITRAGVEGFRGTRCVDPIKQLLAEGLITVVGEEETLGRPYLYGTTAAFLDTHGLTSLDELPGAEELREAG
ncbi:MAG: SMC-Scp complex subunit ScpB [Planctomycetota bacterium]